MSNLIVSDFGSVNFVNSLPKLVERYCRMRSPRDAGHIRGMTLAVRAAQVTSSYHLEAALPITQSGFFAGRAGVMT